MVISGAIVGHDGGTIGQSAFLRLAPGHDVAVALPLVVVGLVACVALAPRLDLLNFTAPLEESHTPVTEEPDVPVAPK